MTDFIPKFNYRISQYFYVFFSILYQNAAHGDTTFIKIIIYHGDFLFNPIVKELTFHKIYLLDRKFVLDLLSYHLYWYAYEITYIFQLLQKKGLQKIFIFLKVIPLNWP